MQTIYSGKYLKVHEKHIGEDLYELAELRSAVVIYAKDQEGRWLFVREHRPHEANRIRLKPVTGFIDDGEDWHQTAQKELREETHLIATDFTLFHHLQERGSMNWDRYFVLATGLRDDPTPIQNPDGDVIQEIVYFDLETAIAKSISGEIPLTTDSLGLFMIKERNL